MLLSSIKLWRFLVDSHLKAFNRSAEEYPPLQFRIVSLSRLLFVFSAMQIEIIVWYLLNYLPGCLINIVIILLTEEEAAKDQTEEDIKFRELTDSF